MNLFGSREDDPLLENDPLAPSSDENTASGEERASDDDSAPSSPAGDGPRTSPSREENDDPGSGNDAPSAGTSNGTGPHFALPGTGSTRTLRRSVETAQEGRLSVLNAAFDQGWRLDRIEYQKETDELLFVLHREASDPESQDLIV